MANTTLKNFIGEVLDEKYRLDKQLGQGGMGAVYLATHLGTQRPVALKLIAPQFMAQAEFVERFRREAEAAGRLRHPNIVNVTDFGFTQLANECVAYLVMEYLEGCSLAEILNEEKGLPLSWVVDIVEQICSAMETAHQQGIVHRDLKPANIWLEPNRRGGYTVKVLDFGLAKLGEPPLLISPNEAAVNLPVEQGLMKKIFSLSPLQGKPPKSSITISHEAAAPPIEPEAITQIQPSIEQEGRTKVLQEVSTDGNHTMDTQAQLTHIGTVLGTPLYMSPEQCQGTKLDARSDIYSLGIITYQMLSGKNPFQGDTDSLIMQHINTIAPPLREKRRDIPKPIAALIMSALAKLPNERPASAEAFANAMRAYSEGIGTFLRQSLTIYSQHFPTLIRLSLLSHIPQIITTIISITYFSLLALRIITKPNPITIVLVSISFFLGAFTSALCTAIVSVPAIVHFLLVPLRPLHIPSLFNNIRKCVKPLFITSIWHNIYTIPRFLLLIIPGLVAFINYSLIMPIVVMEGISGRAALARSKILTRRAWGTALAIVLIQGLFIPSIIGLTNNIFTNQILKWLNTTSHLLLWQYIFNIGFSLIFYPIVNPFVSIGLALLYFKTRQAGGENIYKVLDEQSETSRLPFSQWQARMHEFNYIHSDKSKKVAS